VLVALLALAFIPSASAATQRPFKETFGSAEQPTFGSVQSIAVDQQTGEVFVASQEIGGQSRQLLNRFNADGTPAPFAALGTNEIDGMEANGKPCAEEPASCDKTPQNGIRVQQSQIAIDESGGPTDGDIYLAELVGGRVTIFAADGEYLGQLTEAGVRNFEVVRGVAVDPTGAVYVSNGTVLSKFVPSTNPVVNTDLAASLGPVVGTLGQRVQFQRLAIGEGTAAGSIFANYTEAERYVIPGGGEGQLPVEFVVQLERATGASKAIFGEIKYGAAGYGSENLAVDPTSGNVLIGNGAEYEIVGGAQPRQVGRLVPNNGRNLRAFAVDGSGKALVTTDGFFPTISIYGTPAVVPAATVEPASEIGGTTATLTGTVNPSGVLVSKCIFQYGEVGPSGAIGFEEHEVNCDKGDWEGATDSTPHQVHATVTGLNPNGHAYGFRLVAFNENGSEDAQGLTFTTAHTVVTEPATAINPNAATLNGIVRPEGEPYTACLFEYGLSSNRSFEKTVPCTPGALAIPADFTSHEVRAQITGLQSGATYRYRVVATNAGLGTLKGEEQTFSTLGLPRVVEAQASSATQSSMTLEARINPSGFGTSYRFEWGQTPAYGNFAPIEFAPFIGSGTEPILVQAKISGLAAGSTYHYRVSATSSRGTTRSPDQIAETLNSCGLPEGRCFELVSRSDAGPVAIPGEGNAHLEMHFQAATGGQGGLAYEVESGYPEATKGAEVLYRGSRGPNGWGSTQLSTPITAQNERNSGENYSDAIEFLSNELTCGFVESIEPLTPDPSMRLVREQGGSNLYRINPDGSYTPVTTLPPQNAKGTSGLFNYTMAGASQNCSMAAFSSQYVYPGIPGKGSRLYEWRDGSLRNAGVVPGPSGDVVVEAVAGAGSTVGVRDRENTVSDDGSRVFFTAERQTSTNPAEIGKKAVFVREDGRETRDISLSHTATPDEGAEYQWATADGSRVFFIANAGLTEDSNSEGTDLYEYDLETEELTDRSVTPAEGGAEVDGFLGASADGSRVYFSSPNQLVAGQGNSRAQNVAGRTFSIYADQGGEISFAGTFNSIERAHHVLIENSAGWNSQVSPDGRYLLFETSARVTGYESDGLSEAYLYDADSQQAVCVSCRQDGQPSPNGRYGEPNYSLLTRNESVWNPMHGPRFLTERNGEAQVFFSSPDSLAPGAIAGQNNVYEWSHNQIFRLASATEGAQAKPFPGAIAAYAGGSEDGSDVYLITPETLTWEDGDERLSAYDARIGGGFAQAPAPPAPCQATVETSCQGTGQSASAVPGALTESFSGPGNPKAQPKKAKPKQHSKKKSKQNKKHSKKTQHKKKAKRQANSHGRNGK
jgi:hypothetical protein